MSSIRAEFVDFIPASLSPGVLYISERYRTASHLCACGCGEKVVTPFSPVNWQLIRKGNSVSLHPSIGNWNYACRSHYWIRQNKIVWSRRMSATKIAQVQERDRRDQVRHIEQQNRTKLVRVSTHVKMPTPANTKPSSVTARLMKQIERFLHFVRLQ